MIVFLCKSTGSENPSFTAYKISHSILLVFFLMVHLQLMILFIQGRGFGDCSISWKSSLKGTVPKRTRAVDVCMVSCWFVLFNIYIACDSPNNTSVYMLIWEQIINTCEQFQYDNVIIVRDVNTSLDRTNSIDNALAQVLYILFS